MNNLKKIIDFWKSIWGKLVAFIICGSIVALFIASFCLDKELTLSVMNEWVSLVVGMAALILGIISLYLSFYNVEQSDEMQNKTYEIMDDVKKDINIELNDIKDKINIGFSDMKDRLYINNTSSEISKNQFEQKEIQWKEVKG